MTQNEKELLMKDICGRLPYGVKAYVKNWSKFNRKWIEDVYTVESIHPSLNNILVCSERCSVEVIVGYDDYDIKPYLFPLSSITEEQYDELEKVVLNDYTDHEQITNELSEKVDFITHWPMYSPDIIDWFNANHFDYRGLIEKGLAIDCTNLNIY